MSAPARFLFLPLFSLFLFLFLSLLLSLNLSISLPPPTPLLACSNFYLIWQKKDKDRKSQRRKSHRKNALLWSERMRSRRREEFPRGFIKSVKWLLRIGGTQKPGKFFKEDLCHVIQRKNGNQFSVKNWQSVSWLFSFDKFQALYDVKQLWGHWENQDKCCTINTRIISWTNVDNNFDEHVAHLTNNPFVKCPYLIIVIFFTLTQFLENKIYTQKRQFFALNL